MRFFVTFHIMLLLLSATESKGALVMNILESNGDVIASTSGGSLDLSSLVLFRTSNGGGVVHPAFDGFRIGAAGFDLYTGGSWQGGILGAGSYAFSTFDNGSSVGVSGYLPGVSVPEGYVSGSPIGPASSTWQSETFESLGLSPGTFFFSWGTGESSDSVTLKVIPEPSATLLMGVGVIGLFFFRRRIIRD